MTQINIMWITLGDLNKTRRQFCFAIFLTGIAFHIDSILDIAIFPKEVERDDVCWIFGMCRRRYSAVRLFET